MRVAAIDPGMRAIGFALADGCRIVHALASVVRRSGTPRELADHHASAIGEWRLDEVFVESMRWRPNDRRSQPNDLIDVQTCGILLAAEIGRAARVTPIEPSEWKSSLPKTIHHARLSVALSPSEQAIVDRACVAAGAHDKEVLDAVGILLYALKRIDKAGRVAL